MPNYHDLRPDEDYKERDYALVFPDMTRAEKKRTIAGLLLLKQKLAQIAARKTDTNLLIASWNIKEFGHTGQRLPEAYFYIAEIVACFDLVVIQEIKSTLADLEKLMRLLGDGWEYVVNDVTNGNDGNAERGGYLYNTHRVKLAGLAGEITLWDDLTRDFEVKQLKRAPYITGFRAGWKSFAMINVHLHPGKKPHDLAYRNEEVTLLLKAFAEKQKRGHFWTQNLVLVGDFNFYQQDAETVKQIEQAGFFQIQSLQGLDTNAAKTEAYDRFFLTHNDYFCLEPDPQGEPLAGVIDPFAAVYADGSESKYRRYLLAQYTGKKDLAGNPEELRRYYQNTWRRNQLSDHFPIWFSLCIDSSSEFLQAKAAEL